MTIIPANYGVGFAQINVNMRISRTWGCGESVTANPNQGRRGGGGGGPRGGRFRAAWRRRRPGGGGPPGGGGGFFGGGDASGKKYTLTAGLYVRNIFNTVNPGLPEGDLLSPRFGETLALATCRTGRDAVREPAHGDQSPIRILAIRSLPATGCYAVS